MRVCAKTSGDVNEKSDRKNTSGTCRYMRVVVVVGGWVGEGEKKRGYLIMRIECVSKGCVVREWVCYKQVD